MSRSNWRPEMIPDLQGKTFLVTGANSGIGLEAVKRFAANGAEIIMACRNPEKAETAAQEIRTQAPSARLEIMTLDLADLSSISEFADAVKCRFGKVDVLLNNAGLMAPPLQRTHDGFEMQFGTNHLGHFALTGQLLPVLEAAPSPRIVQITSVMHLMGKFYWNNLNAEKWYSRWAFYGQSKLANLVYARDLNRRLEEDGSRVRAFAAHPGYSATHLQDTVVGGQLINKVMAQPATMGCLPGVMAATSVEVDPGGYYGPDGRILELRGYPAKAFARRIADNREVAQRLWDESEALTGVRYLNGG